MKRSSNEACVHQKRHRAEFAVPSHRLAQNTNNSTCDDHDLPLDTAPCQSWRAAVRLGVKGESSERFGFSTCFFRQFKGTTEATGDSFSNGCMWTLIDYKQQQYIGDSLIDGTTLELIRQGIEEDVASRPQTDMDKALLELIKKGKLPRPDRKMTRAPEYSIDPFVINFDDECTLRRTFNDQIAEYHFQHTNISDSVVVDVYISAEKNASVNCVDASTGFFPIRNYFPAVKVHGTIISNGEKFEVEGEGVYYREFAPCSPLEVKKDPVARCCLSFSNGSRFYLYNRTEKTTQKRKSLIGIFTDEHDDSHVCDDVKFSHDGDWTSLVTFLSYPQHFSLTVPSIQLNYSFAPIFAPQEFVTVLANGSGFYNASISGTGELSGEPIHGTGFIEYTLGEVDNSTRSLIKRVSKFVNNTLTSMYPLEGGHSWVHEHVLGNRTVDSPLQPQKICNCLFEPVRALIDRGGKSWRSLILVACCNALSRTYFDCTKYIAMAELLHVGSLIIDDIQDNSTIRRGGKCVHLEYGVATAINAGTACYFMAPQLAEIHKLPPVTANRIYQLYFDILRVGHVGQGLDIYGLGYLMPDVVATGDAGPLCKALDAIHTYKTGGAAGSVCMMACILCGAKDEVCKELESFGLNIGLAFQIIDDAMNIRGFEGGLKEACEDVREGKITYPVAKALEKLSYDERVIVWGIMQERSSDEARVSQLVQLVEKTGAIEACFLEARRLVEQSWKRLDPILDDSFSKHVIWTFCNFLTQRPH